MLTLIPEPAPLPDGFLLRAPDAPGGDRTFFCVGDRRHWIAEAAWFPEHGHRIEEARTVSRETLATFQAARPAPRRRGTLDWLLPPRDGVRAMRETLVAPLRGSGVEVGAGASPMPIPLAAEVRYMDLYDLQTLQANLYDGQHPEEFVAPTLRGSLDDLGAIPDGSVDFIVACHVIEHVRNPIGAMVRAWHRLRPGGHLALVVPEMTRTFDRDRAETTLSHLIEDDRDPSRDRDEAHFREFYAKAQFPGAHLYETTWREKFAEDYPIHYHAWTHAGFVAVARWVMRNAAPFRALWHHPPLPDGGRECIEFYVCLTK